MHTWQIGNLFIKMGFVRFNVSHLPFFYLIHCQVFNFNIYLSTKLFLKLAEEYFIIGSQIIFNQSLTVGRPCMFLGL